MKIFLSTILTLLCSSTFTHVFSQSKSILQRADQYSTVLRRFQTQKKNLSIERVIRKGKSVAEKYDELEALTDAEYAALEKKMKGYLINREEVLIIKPDLRFFSDLSQRKGTNSDVAYFSLMREIRPDSVWAAYLEQQTDVTGCTIYGRGFFAKFYRKLLKFKSAYPRSFVSDINEEITDLLQHFVDGTCACGTAAGVQKELRLFVRMFPKDKNTPRVKKKLIEIATKRDFRFNCLSG